LVYILLSRYLMRGLLTSRTDFGFGRWLPILILALVLAAWWHVDDGSIRRWPGWLDRPSACAETRSTASVNSPRTPGGFNDPVPERTVHIA
jgi:hypothetical protein